MILLPTKSWEIRDTVSKGKGVFTSSYIPKGTIIAEYIGSVTPFIAVDYEKYEDYLMYFNDDSCIVPDLSKTGAHLINHSCSPNAWMHIKNGHIYFVSIKEIHPDEEITIHYLYPPSDGYCKDCSHMCKCGSENCQGTMHTEEKLYERWHGYLNRSKANETNLPFRP